MVECPRQCGWAEPVGSLFALGPTLTAARSEELRTEHEADCPLHDGHTAALEAEALGVDSLARLDSAIAGACRRIRKVLP